MIRSSLCAVTLALLFTGAASAAPPLEISGAWVRQGPPDAAVLAAYMHIDNPGSEEIVIVGAASPQFERVEIHRTEIQDGMARMLPQDRLPVPAGAGVVLEPGGLHLMLIQARQPLESGARVAIELQLDGGARLPVEAEVRPAQGGGTDHSHHHRH